MRKILQILSIGTYKSYGISVDEFLDELIIKDKENKLLHAQEKQLLHLKNKISDNNYYLKQNNMRTKLEIGTEYWLDKCKDESGVFVGLDGGYLLFKPSKNCVLYVTDDEYIKLSDDGRIYIEVKHQKSWQFTTPIAMKCTEEQFNEIKDKLVEMGYKEVCMSNWDESDYIVNNLMKHIGSLSNIFDVDANEFGRIMVDTFNPDLFLAPAAMTDKEDGIKGEWWKSERGFAVQGVSSVTGLKLHRKATAQEIIEHFEKKEFVLPKFWHVVVTEENVDVLSKWRFGDEYPKHKLNIGYIVGFSSWQNSRQHNPSDSRGSFGSEITFDQFKKYVLKETTQSCQIIPIPPTKQATLFDDRVEITDWKPKDNDEVLVVSINVDGWGLTKTKYKFVAEPYKANGFIKRTESEAKRLVEKLKQAML